jgi:hypothetical protein
MCGIKKLYDSLIAWETEAPTILKMAGTKEEKEIDALIEQTFSLAAPPKETT